MDYREKIIEMVKGINNENVLRKIYSFVKVFYEDIKRRAV